MDVILLTKYNYKKWKSCMESYLISEDLWNIVCGNDSTPPKDYDENGQAFNRWKKKNAKASFILKRSISDDLFDHITNCDSASSIWITIDSLFKKIEEDSVKNLEYELTKLSINKDGGGELKKSKQKKVVATSALKGSEVDKKQHSVGESTQFEQVTTDVAADESKVEQQEIKAGVGLSRPRRTIRQPGWMKDYVLTDKEKRGKAKESK